MDEQNDQKETVLHLCCKEGNKEIAQILLDHGASLYEVDTNHETPLHKEWVHLRKSATPSDPRDYIEELTF